MSLCFQVVLDQSLRAFMGYPGLFQHTCMIQLHVYILVLFAFIIHTLGSPTAGGTRRGYFQRRGCRRRSLGDASLHDPMYARVSPLTGSFPTVQECMCSEYR